MDAVPAVGAHEVSAWSDEVDVLVVGAGMAGVSAAIDAATAGARVLVVDRGGRLTCTSAMSGGHFYLGGGTAVQQATGWEDTPADMAAYLRAMSPSCDPEKIRLYAADSVEHFGWLESLGFAFERSYYPHKAVVQPGTQGLMFTGNEKCWPFTEIARPAPRGHKPPFEGDMGGGGFVVELALAKLDALGVEVRYDTGATGLVVDGDAVTGATWRRFDEAGAIRARSVVLAAGGFVLNPAMVETYAPRLGALFARGMALGNTYDDGLGIRLGESVGGVADHMEGAFFTAPFYPPEGNVRGVVVNAAGRRFVNEDAYHSRVAAYVFDQPGQAAYLILDAATMERPGYGFQPLVDGWETIPEMEAGLGLPAGSLVETLGAYNAAAPEDPAFHKASEYVVPLDQGPWGAYDLTPGACFYSGFSCGGLRVTPDGQVLRSDGSVVAGAYAAGACASNIAVDGRGYSSGTQLGEASYFGRRAGRHAALARA
ncbi:succinate dehydrogenase/fumarate reductase flavoprotein subunit [Cryptosporangium arvum DSM 44712]|uniref:Succinate dehydrogenase/fumarate reductase flavoprotein subunit n=1 Tax=Cryptosporangium arvum DSM 44712 TaxID=927661 RepID=A0A011A0A5_9ACTN|nr:FAD-binding protein [Cryptosporangium arvum]EXG82922.1 succinate dehydrogenase/fumarate reductase flavoprotein subunit [Cryptosporangium arvum DSM 44712]